MESFVSLGRLHLPLLSLFAAGGLMGALALGLRTATLARLDRDRFWNLCVVTVLSAFVLSRALLIAENVHVFLHFPLAVLELPALSAGGLLLTIVMAFWYVRRQGLSLAGVFDAAAPCIALLTGFYRLGLYAGGMREGMLTSAPWAVASSFGQVHPVELYEAGGWLALSGMLVWLLARDPRRGVTVACALIGAGLIDAITDFFHLPHALYGAERLEGMQRDGVELIVIGSLLLAWRLAARTRQQGRPEAANDAI